MGTSAPPSTFDRKFSAILGLVIGAVFIGGGFWVRAREAREQATMVETQGTVIDTVPRRIRNNSTGKDVDGFEPVIEFQVNGSPIRFNGTWVTFRESKGNRSVVRYDPKDPAATARVIDALEGLTQWAVFAMGALSLASGLRGLFRRSESGSSASGK